MQEGEGEDGCMVTRVLGLQLYSPLRRGCLQATCSFLVAQKQQVSAGRQCRASFGLLSSVCDDRDQSCTRSDLLKGAMGSYRV